MRIAVTGSSGLIGSAIVESLTAGGHDVVRLVRRPARTPAEVQWDPDQGSVDLPGLKGVEAAVHLAGANVGDRRWTDAYKREIRDSRVLGTRTLVRALTSIDPMPRVLVCGSAIGIYGDGGEQPLTESAPLGDTFLAGVVRDWEAESHPAAEAGIRVVLPRSGLIMSRSGGAFGRLLPLIKLGVIGPLGNGRQWWSFITLEDEVAAIQFLLEKTELDGPVNLAWPRTARQGDVVKAIADRLHRPSFIPAPGFALKAILGEFAGELLISQRVVPERLTAAGFTFAHPDLATAIDWLTA